eukprot:TRINITY_DN2472_c0_g1_i1.p1 TRINITY_DN2472_c0_g1~~TRINITY_DN2472_c0_g1_i1.p1  ORF type:complete len:2237 (+),score=571.05 TRINITY_DN2472_c0_g1_i1:1980-8690(+)
MVGTRQFAGAPPLFPHCAAHTETERNLKEIQELRPLSLQDCQAQAENTTSTAAVPLNKIPGPQQAALKELCVTQMKKRANRLFEYHQQITVDNKKKTLGVDSAKLLFCLAEMLHHLCAVAHLQSHVNWSLQELTQLVDKLLEVTASGFAIAKAVDVSLYQSVVEGIAELAHCMNGRHAQHAHFASIAETLVGFILDNQPADLSVGSCDADGLSAFGDQRAAIDDIDLDDDNQPPAAPPSASLGACVAACFSTLGACAECAECARGPLSTIVHAEDAGGEPRIKRLLELNLPQDATFEMCHALLKLPNTEAGVAHKLSDMLYCVRIAGSTSLRDGVVRAVAAVARKVCRGTSLGDMPKEQRDSIAACIDVVQVLGRLYDNGQLHWSTRRELARCMQNLLRAEVPDLADLIGEFLQLLSDPDYRVRAQMARSVLVLFELFAKHAKVFQDVCAKLPLGHKDVTCASEEEAATSLQTLGEIGSATPLCAHLVLFMLCTWPHALKRSAEKLRLQATVIVRYMAQRLGYHSGRQLVEEHLEYLVSRWTRGCDDMKPLPLDEFPFHITGSPSFPAFVKSYAGIIVPRLVHSCSAAGISQVAGILGADPRTVLRDNFSRIFAYVYPLHYVDGKQAEGTAIWEFLTSTYIKKKEITELISDHIESILVWLFELLWFPAGCDDDDAEADGDEASCPPYDATAVEKVLQNLAEGYKEAVSDLFFKQGKFDRVHGILLHISKRMASTSRPQERKRLLRVFEFFVNHLDDKAFISSVFRDCAFSVVRAVKYDGLCGPACKILREICEKALRQEDIKAVLCSILHDIVSALPYSQGGVSAAGLLDFVRWVVTSPSLESAVRDLDPFDDTPEFAEINAVHRRLRGDAGWSNELLKFVRNQQRHAASSLTTTLLSRLRHFSQQLQAQKQELIAMLNGDDTQRKLIAELVWLLIKQSQTSSEDVKLQIGECLGEIGFLDPSTLGEIRAEDPNPYLVAGGDANKSILQLLDTYLTDPDVSVVEVASATIKAVLGTTAGARACLQLENEQQRFLQPFTWGSTAAQSPSQLAQRTLSQIDDVKVWIPEQNSYCEWLQQLTFILAAHPTQDKVLQLCGPVCLHKLQFAEFLFPRLILNIVETGDQQLTQQLTHFFKILLSTANPHKESVLLVLHTLNFLRNSHCSKSKKSSSWFWDTPFWRDLSLLDVANAALRCSAYLTSLLYVELHCQKQLLPQAVRLGVPADDEQAINAILLVIFSNISEPDSIYGVSNVDNIRAQLLTDQHEQQWHKVLGKYDTLLQMQASSALTSGGPNTIGLVTCLKTLGHYHLLDTCLEGMSLQPAEMPLEVCEFQYEMAWRRMKWELDLKQVSDSAVGVQQAIYMSLRALKEKDENQFMATVRQSRLNLVNKLAGMSHESSKELFPVLVLLQLQAEVCSAWGASRGACTAQRLLAQWRNAESQTKGAFPLVEPILEARKVVLKILGQEDSLPQLSLNYSSAARRAKCFSIAFTSLYQSKGSDPSLAFDYSLEECKLMRDQGEYTKAINTLKNTAKQLEIVVSSPSAPSTSKKAAAAVLGKVLCNIGKWMSESHSERGSIIGDYLRNSVKSAVEQGGSNVCKSYFTMAHFSDTVYQNFVKQSQSPEWETAQNLQALRQRDLEQCKALKHMPEDLKSHYYFLQKQVAWDSKESERIETEKEDCLFSAVNHYIGTLSAGDRYDLAAAFRLCSLWFSNNQNEELSKLVGKSLPALQTRKFVPLFYQVASRLMNEDSAFQETLNALIERTVQDHPQNTLWQIYALGHSDKSKQQQTRYVVDTSKVQAAQRMLQKLEKTKLQPLMQQMQHLINAYNGLAYLEITRKQKDDKKPIAMPSFMRNIADLTYVAVPTAHTPVDTTCKYLDIIHVARFQPTFALVGGVNLPKCINCVGSNGMLYKQLVKAGRDDLRQDAVMEQMFQMVNSMLQESHQTRMRDLKIRTYKVIPLSSTSGLLEWVQNTIPIGEYLVGSERTAGESAHGRYHPRDWPSHKCRDELRRRTDKYRAFQDICANFKPAFHHFFLENFPTSSEWFAKRLRYTRSVASNSIVGYIVGLGDRHASNILVDRTTAELVHIDLGIAFEQGKLLKTPELVPFRLTRDLVDGMGITGVEGAFRRCCEETLRLLRARHLELLTIVEVFIHDPLCRWADVHALRKRQQDDDGTGEDEESTGNKDAEGALLRLSQKLQGIEYGETLSPEGQVNQLITEAQDPELLCKMYDGWAPWV